MLSESKGCEFLSDCFENNFFQRIRSMKTEFCGKVRLIYMREYYLRCASDGFALQQVSSAANGLVCIQHVRISRWISEKLSGQPI